jgi:predicted dehydrogenase
MASKYRGVVLEADHWHLQSHLKGLKALREVDKRAEITAMSGSGPLSQNGAKELGVPLYETYLELLDNEKCDFAYVFGPHRVMPAIISECIKRSIPFIAEKPCAIDPALLAPLVVAVESMHLPHVVPLWRRFAPIVTEYRDFIRDKVSAGPVHFHFRYITGSPERYINLGCAWGTKRSEAGGGCLMNLGSHYIDLTRYLSREEIVSVEAQINTGVWDTDEDDFAAVVLRTAGGSTATIEVGYTKPGAPYELYNISGKGFYLTGETDIGTRLLLSDGTMKEGKLPGGDRYDINLGHLLDMIDGKPVTDECTLADQLECLRVIDAAYRRGGYKV